MSNFTTFVASFGSRKTGLLTVGYRQVNNAGGDAVARTTTGVYEIGGGGYAVQVTPNLATVSLEWDTGEVVAVFAHEDLLDYFNKKVLIDRQETDPVTGQRRILEEDDATTMVEGDIFEDIAGTTPYDGTGTGIDRSDRMT